MVDMAVKFEAVRRMALALDNVEEGTSYGTPAFKVGGVLFLRLHQDLDSLVVRMDLERREEMMAADPEASYITEHYLNYPWMLVRLARVHRDALQDLIATAWRASARKRHGVREVGFRVMKSAGTREAVAAARYSQRTPMFRAAELYPTWRTPLCGWRRRMPRVDKGVRPTPDWRPTFRRPPLWYYSRLVAIWMG